MKDNQPIRSLANCVTEAGHKLIGSGDDDSEPSPSDRELVQEFLSWKQRQDSSWAACVNLMDTHYPFLPKPEFDNWGDGGDRSMQSSWRMEETFRAEDDGGWEQLRSLERLYNGTILQADAIVHEIVEGLRQTSDYEDTLIVITSDHGEGFGEESLVEPGVRMAAHRWGIHEVLTHVPLLVKWPNQDTGERVSDVASLARFPSAVESVLRKENDTDAFTQDEYVLSFTNRLLESKVDSYSFYDGIDSHVGPWYAVYEDHGEAVRKYIVHGDKSLTVEIPDAQTQTVINSGGVDIVKSVFDSTYGPNISYEEPSENLAEDVESRLEDLGYIR